MAESSLGQSVSDSHMDALIVKVRDGNHVVNKAFYLALGINLQGTKEILGIWVEKTEGAKFWLQILTDLKNRGVEDILIACVDGLKGFPETIVSVFPKAQVQLCIVHMVRNSLKWVSYKQKKELVIDLKAIYKSPSEEIAKKSLDDFSAKWDSQYPMISKSWRNNWESVIPFLAYPPNIRKAIYTTNAIESMNMGLRKIIKNRGSFPTDEAAVKLLYLALNNMSKKWTMPIQDWDGERSLESEPLSSSDEPVCDYFRRSIESRFILKKVIYTVLLIPPRRLPYHPLRHPS